MHNILINIRSYVCKVNKYIIYKFKFVLFTCIALLFTFLLLFDMTKKSFFCNVDNFRK